MKHYIRLISLALVILFVLIPGCNNNETTTSTTLTTAQSDIEVARLKGQEWITQTASKNTELAQWAGGILSQPETYSDLSGQIVAYLFQIEAKGGIAGHILVGSAPYNYPIINADTSAPPFTPDAGIIADAFKKRGYATDGVNFNTPIKLLLTSPESYYSVFIIDGQEVAINNFSKKIVIVSELKSYLPTPEEYNNAIQQMKESGNISP